VAVRGTGVHSVPTVVTRLVVVVMSAGRSVMERAGTIAHFGTRHGTVVDGKHLVVSGATEVSADRSPVVGDYGDVLSICHECS